MADSNNVTNILDGIADAVTNVDNMVKDQQASRESLAESKKTYNEAKGAADSVVLGIADQLASKQNAINKNADFELAAIADQIEQQNLGKAREQAEKDRMDAARQTANDYQAEANKYINLTNYQDEEGKELGFFGKVGAFFNKEENFRKAVVLNQQSIDYRNVANKNMQNLGLIKSQTVQNIAMYSDAEAKAKSDEINAGKLLKLSNTELAADSARLTALTTEIGLDEAHMARVGKIFKQEQDILAGNLGLAGAYINVEQLNQASSSVNENKEEADSLKELLRSKTENYNTIYPQSPIDPAIVDALVDSRGDLDLNAAAALLGQDYVAKLSFLGTTFTGDPSHTTAPVPTRLEHEPTSSVFSYQYDNATNALSDAMPEVFDVQQKALEAAGVKDLIAWQGLSPTAKQESLAKAKEEMANDFEQLKGQAALSLSSSTGDIVMSKQLLMDQGMSEELAGLAMEFAPDDIKDGSILNIADMTKSVVGMVDNLSTQLTAKKITEDQQAAMLAGMAKSMKYLTQTALTNNYGELYTNMPVDKLSMDIRVVDDGDKNGFKYDYDITDPTSLARLLTARTAKKRRAQYARQRSYSFN